MEELEGRKGTDGMGDWFDMGRDGSFADW